MGIFNIRILWNLQYPPLDSNVGHVYILANPTDFPRSLSFLIALS